MVDMSAIATALSSLAAAKDIAQAMIGLRDSAAFQGKLIEFQSKLIDANNAAFAAQEERSALLQQIRDLEAKVAKLETWETEKQRYELKQFRQGGFAYQLKQERRAAEPPHYICPNCYQEGRKSILQGRESHSFGWSHTCHSCKLEVDSNP